MISGNFNPSSDGAWAVAKPIVIYGDYLKTKANTATEMRLKEIGEYVMTGGLGQSNSTDVQEQEGVSAEGIGEAAFVFGMTPFIFRTLLGLTESPAHTSTYAENGEFYTGLDISNKLGFKIMKHK